MDQQLKDINEKIFSMKKRLRDSDNQDVYLHKYKSFFGQEPPQQDNNSISNGAMKGKQNFVQENSKAAKSDAGTR